MSTMKSPPLQFIEALSEVHKDWELYRRWVQRFGYFNKTYCSEDYLDKEAARCPLPSIEN